MSNKNGFVQSTNNPNFLNSKQIIFIDYIIEKVAKILTMLCISAVFANNDMRVRFFPSTVY